MADLLAGTTVLAEDFPPTQSDTEATDETGFSDTSYVAGAAECGVAFVAPTTGRVTVLWHARAESNTASVRVMVSAEVREGDTIGSGTVVSAASDSSAIESSSDPAGGGSSARTQGAMFRVVSGLTAGDSYNARTMHALSGAGTGDIFDRTIAVLPAP